MTKFILHGGASSTESIHNDNFFKEMLKGLDSSVNILLIYFATVEDRWDSLLEDDKNKFSKANTENKELNFVIASKEIDELEQQIKDADLLYMRGGVRTDVLVKTLSQIKDFAGLIMGKVVAGSSAGAYALSKYYFSKCLGLLGEGLGILPIKCLAHYNLDEYRGHLEELKNYKEDLEIYKIPETEFVVIKK